MKKCRIIRRLLRIKKKMLCRIFDPYGNKITELNLMKFKDVIEFNQEYTI